MRGSYPLPLCGEQLANMARAEHVSHVPGKEPAASGPGMYKTKVRAALL